MVEQKYINRFWNRVDKISHPNGCWIWTGPVNKDGYGHTGGALQKYLGTFRSNRVSAALAGMDINDKDKPFVCHTCDNPACVNPMHMFMGSAGDNSNDRNKKNRTAKGERQGSSILTQNQVEEIRSKYIPKVYTKPMLAKEYNVSIHCIKDVVYNQSWKHVI